MAESMDEESLHDALEVMEAPVIHGVGLDGMNQSLLLITKIFVNLKEVKDGIDDQRTQVFTKEECSVRHLWTQILENNCKAFCIFIRII